jgi:uncharacterized repeat protein (TIGR03803 family)
MKSANCTKCAVVVSSLMALFAIPSSAQTYKVLHTFTYGIAPQGVIAQDAAGNLYGTTANGGYNCFIGGAGIVWKLAKNSDGTWTSTVLHAFLGQDGAYPLGGVTLDKAGNLYGTTREGGNPNLCKTNDSYGCGTVFKLSPMPNGSWAFSELHQFADSDGAFPDGRLSFDAADNLYGTTDSGGTANLGVVFKLADLSGEWKESVIHDFTGADGAGPQAGVIFDTAGNMYGTTRSGGANDAGTIFELVSDSGGSWTENLLYSFSAGADGWAPSSDLTFDNSGNLYGTAEAGGTGPFLGGVVFKLSSNRDGSWTETVLHSFTGGGPGVRADGNAPVVGVTFDANGNLYGTTPKGGVSSYGVVFKLAPTTNAWKETIVHTFLGYGAVPLSPVLVDSAGHVYGSASASYSGIAGLIFEITP